MGLVVPGTLPAPSGEGGVLASNAAKPDIFAQIPVGSPITEHLLPELLCQDEPVTPVSEEDKLPHGAGTQRTAVDYAVVYEYLGTLFVHRTLCCASSLPALVQDASVSVAMHPYHLCHIYVHA